MLSIFDSKKRKNDCFMKICVLIREVFSVLRRTPASIVVS